MRIALGLLLPALLVGGCATSAEGPAPAPPTDPSTCGHFTNVLGLVGQARYPHIRDPTQVHAQLDAAGFAMHPDPEAIAGTDPAGSRFAMTGSFVYEVYYPWNDTEPWPSENASRRANGSWMEDASARFDASVAAFEAATGLQAIDRTWRPDLVSGTTRCP